LAELYTLTSSSPKGKKETTFFPGSLIFPPPEAREKGPWNRLIRCLQESGGMTIKLLKGDAALSRNFVYT